MKLRALELEQFRKFDRPVRLSGLSDGLNVLCGPNEFGKSTLLAAVKGVLFERHSSKAEPVRRMQPLRGDAAPRLAMEFDLGQGCWRIEKRFMHKPWARLTGPDGASFEADAAEEELQRLLGFGAAGKKGATSEQLGIWGALWVSQRQSVEQPDFTSGLARSAVSHCLDTEVGVLTGSEKGQLILQAAKKQLADLVDGNRKPKGRYKEVVGVIGEISQRLAELREREQRLAADCEDFRRKTALCRKAEDPEDARQQQVKLSEARRLREAAQLFDQKRAAVAAQHAHAASKVVDAERERNDRRNRRANIAAKDGIRNEADRTVKAAVNKAKEAQDALASYRSLETAARERSTIAADALRKQWAIRDAVQTGSALAALNSSLDSAIRAQEEIAGFVAQLGDLKVDKDRIDEIRKAARDRDAAQSQLQAQATAIDFEIESAGSVVMDGVAVAPGRTSVAVVTPTELALAGIGRIVVRPAIHDLQKLRKRAAGLDRLLDSVGCNSLEEAEQRYAERDAADSALRNARHDVERLTPGDPSSDLQPGVEALRERVEVLSLQSAASRRKLGLAELPSRELAAAAVAAAEEEDRAARAELTHVQADMDAAVTADSSARSELIRAEATAKAATAEIERLTRDNADAEARETDANLAARLEAAEAERATYADALARLDAQQSPDTVEAMDLRIKRLEEANQNRAAQIRTLRDEIIGLQTRITQEGGAGLDEAIALLDREHDALTQERDGYAREVRVLTLLIETLTAAERETKARYLAPVTRRVTPYLARLFPGAEITCDDDLRVTGITRDGSGLQDFERLSDGTQEQVAVLARLAFAEMLNDQGKPAMVILDDALAWSDDERIERMFDVLTHASARIQILVLSCREDLFARLGGHRLELTSVTDRS
jgi:energy-coupling factor transporter ATP-binding protein EcfA2